ncbi:hypothetical protein Sango_2087400 [Sesamum angolense]|uniref:Aminotransferase-like plant mobile domain-containing protein n=1 Tax=Sesamum angolense TaxID=2727404 RepID=A0AAE1WBQ9_9LAMI|nr:hypothetical protein Sango_2087400 [Sesamum angolense]
MSLLVTNYQTTSLIYALWVVPSLKVMQSGMAIFDLPENSATRKGYWEWTEDVLSRCGDRLRHLKIYDDVYISLFTYDHNSDIVKAFCEACCPLTNTLLTSAGELSISLWDLHELVGLPITGCLYDEVVPSALELTGVDERRKDLFLVPVSICFMLTTCFKVPMIIDDPTEENVRPKSTHNPLGDIAIHERWSTAEEVLFAKLCIERSLTEEVYLAAYLACWLCVFVLPGKDVNSTRPSTFKMASLMANGQRVNLAIPVLASIYEGLNTIATSLKPVGMSHSFSIHFVYAWLACCFKTHYSVWQELRGLKMTRFFGEGGAKYYEPQEARKQIHKAEFVSWACNMLVKYRPFKFVDDGYTEDLDHSYLVAIRSSYLTLRQGGRFIIEPYSPHRFRRQFGYYQDIPRTLKHDTCVASLEEGLRYWRLCVLSKSSSKAWFPYNIAYLIRPKSIKITLKRKKNEGKQVDGGENNPPHALVPPVVIKCDSPATVVETSESKDVQAKARKEASEVQSATDELEHIKKEIVVLKGRRMSLRATLKGKKQLSHQTQAKVHDVEKDIATLENTSPLDDSIVENLESSKASLETFKEDLKSLNPFA